VQVIDDPIDEFGPASRLVEVLDPKQELPAMLARPRMTEHRAKSVSQVQPSGRRRREAGGDQPFAP
jgi:hypothetical protein